VLGIWDFGFNLRSPGPSSATLLQATTSALSAQRSGLSTQDSGLRACPLPRSLPWGSEQAYLQVGPLDPANAAGGVAPGELGGKDELIPRQPVGSCCFYLLCDRLNPGQMFLYFCPERQEDIRKINNESLICGLIQSTEAGTGNCTP
jgi:hypothetical protein